MATSTLLLSLLFAYACGAITPVQPNDVHSGSIPAATPVVCPNAGALLKQCFRTVPKGRACLFDPAKKEARKHMMIREMCLCIVAEPEVRARVCVCVCVVRTCIEKNNLPR